MRLWAWGQSDPGRKRERNEDSYLVDTETGVMAVADGMGGHQGGATASRMAVEYLGRELADVRGNFDAALLEQIQMHGAIRTTEEMPVVTDLTEPNTPPVGSAPVTGQPPVRGSDPTLPPGMVAAFSPALEVMRGVVKRASSAIFEASWAKPELRGMGTTLTAMLVHGGRAHVVHAGDSRCYVFRDGQLRQLTEDHSWIQEQVRAGLISPEEARESRFRNIITRSVGFEPSVEPDLTALSVQAGDCFVICSDGLSNYLSADEVGQVLTGHFYRDVAKVFVDMANERGGDDNVTCLVVYAANEA